MNAMVHGSVTGGAIITGAAQGLGEAIARRLAADGYAVALLDRQVALAQTVAASIREAGGKAEAFSVDVSSGASVDDAFDAAFEWSGDCRVLVSNAAVFGDDPILEMTEAAWDRLLGVNLKGAFLCGQAFARRLVAQGSGGVIVNIASTAGFSARPGAAHYSASKAGIVMLTKSLAQELGPMGIRAVAVAPALLEIEGDGITQQYRDAFKANVPSGRVGTVTDVTAAVAFLASESAAFVNGVCLPVDGGLLTGRQVGRTGQPSGGISASAMD